MDINDLTIREARDLSRMFCNSQTSENPWKIGANYLIRTATMIDTGRVVAVTEHEVVLEDAAWIADTGRFHSALATCEFSEVEPFPTGRILIGRAAIIDAVEITKLPRLAK